MFIIYLYYIFIILYIFNNNYILYIIMGLCPNTLHTIIRQNHENYANYFKIICMIWLK